MTYYKRPAPGQANMANSEPVVIASDQSAIDVEVTASALPTGAATETTSVAIKDAVESIDLNTTSILAAVDGLEAPIQTQGAVYTPGATTVISGVRQDATGAPSGVADGDVHPFVFNEEGRLKTSTQPAIYPATTGTITGNGQTVSVDVSRASNLMFHVTGTFSTVNCTFEGSIDGGTTWFATQAVRTNANTVELVTGNLSATPAYAWEASVNALTHFRVRATAYTSGTQTWRFLPGAYATEPIPAIQAHAVTGSGNFAVTMAANATTTPAKARDAVAGASDTGIPNLFVRRDAPTAVTPAAGDWEIPQISNLGAQYVAPVAHTAGGATPYKLVSAASTNATSVKASAGQIYSITAMNTNAAVRYLKLYNKASAPTVGTDTPVQVYALPPSGGITLSIPVGMAFATGIALATTTGAADSDNTGVALSEIVISLTYL
jgi:hypothetical protein